MAEKDELIQSAPQQLWRRSVYNRLGTGTLNVTSVVGFLWVPNCSGVPTGTPTLYEGLSPMVVDVSNNRLYLFSGGAWRNVGP